jgi:hypothetical protein
MNKNQIKTSNYADKDEFISSKKFLIVNMVEKCFINKFNYRIAMSIFKYDKSNHKRQNWNL